MAASVPVIAVCGVGLGVLLMGIFVLEAFVGEVYDGFGKEVVVSPRFRASFITILMDSR
jgi:anoctamin-10